MNNSVSRRKFVTHSLQGTLAAAIGSTITPLSAAPEAPASPSPAPEPEAMPKGRIGKLELSRLMLGTNIITGHMHSRGLFYLKEFSAHYHTDEKILETFALSEQHGINTFMTHHEAKIVRLFTEHRRRGSKMRWIVAPTPEETKNLAEFEKTCRALKSYGADALYVHGAAADPLVQGGKVDQLRECVEIIKNVDLPAGIAAHDLEVIKASEAAKIPCDYYVKTFHSLNYSTAPKPEQITKPYAEMPLAYWCSDPVATSDFMKTVHKPWIAYKVMAAGAILPQYAFQYAFAKGADFILAGIFDWQVATDAKIARECHAKCVKRDRPWCG
ncbi:MAG: hypothetical protein WCO56_24795 [Verrucomicrobiota bacterium]